MFQLDRTGGPLPPWALRPWTTLEHEDALRSSLNELNCLLEGSCVQRRLHAERELLGRLCYLRCFYVVSLTEVDISSLNTPRLYLTKFHSLWLPTSVSHRFTLALSTAIRIFYTSSYEIRPPFKILYFAGLSPNGCHLYSSRIYREGTCFAHSQLLNSEGSCISCLPTPVRRRQSLHLPQIALSSVTGRHMKTSN